MDYRIFILFSVFVTAGASKGETLDDRVQRVVSSSVVLNCPSTTTDIETVKWKINSSDVPFLSYFPKDDAVVPPDYDQRFVIKRDTSLHISNVTWGDSGTYKCSIASAALPMELTHSVYLTIIGGCYISNYSKTLLSANETCYPSSCIKFGSQCSFTCETDFKMIGNASSQCLANGSLSNDLPMCTASMCRVPEMAPHVTSLSQNCYDGGKTTVNSSCTFECEEGFILKGDNVTTCNSDGNFDKSLPTCKDNTCFITSIPTHTIDINLNCTVGSNISYHTICIFTCKFGYKLNGSSTTTCLGHDQFSEDFPSCKASSHQERPRNRVSFDTDGDEINIGLVLPRQRKYIKDLFKGFYQLLTRQIDKNNRIAILHKLHDIELTHILPSIPTSETIDFIRTKVSSKRPETASIEQAFSWYITVMLSFIEDTNVSSSIKREILGMTGQKDEDTQRLLETFSFCSRSSMFKISEDKSTKDYLNLVHNAFAKVLETEGQCIQDEKEKSNRTAKVAREMDAFLGQHETIPEGNGSSTKSKSTGQSDDCVNDDIYFAQLCVRHIAECEYVIDAIELRYRILEMFITPSAR